MRALTRPDPEYNCNPTTEINRLRSYRDATHVDSILDHRGRRPPPTPPRLTNLRVDPPTHRLRKGQRLRWPIRRHRPKASRRLRTPIRQGPARRSD